MANTLFVLYTVYSLFYFVFLHLHLGLNRFVCLFLWWIFGQVSHLQVVLWHNKTKQKLIVSLRFALYFTEMWWWERHSIHNIKREHVCYIYQCRTFIYHLLYNTFKVSDSTVYGELVSLYSLWFTVNTCTNVYMYSICLCKYKCVCMCVCVSYCPWGPH